MKKNFQYVLMCLALTLGTVCFVSCGGSQSGNADESAAVEEDLAVYEVVEEAPTFPGGEAACMQWLASNMKYPETCKEQGIEGRVVASFVVNKDGSVSDVEIVSSPDSLLSQEAERVLTSMPAWTPGTLNGAPVRVKFTLPVTFRLNGGVSLAPSLEFQ